MDVRLVAAAGIKGTIGFTDSMALPWSADAGDLAWFKQVTTGTVMVAGYKTYHYLKSLNLDLETTNRHLVLFDARPLKGAVALDYMRFLLDCKHAYGNKPISIIGGADTYRRFVPFINKFLITRIVFSEIAGENYVRMPPEIILPWPRK